MSEKPVREPGSSYRKRWAEIPFILLLCVALITPAAAHPPSDMTLSYSLTDEDLSVTITHFVSNMSDHYIASVEVRASGSSIVSQHYTSQPERATFTYHYRVAAKTGDQLEVTATCNKYGSLTRTLVVSSVPANVTGSGIPPLWPYHMGFLSAGFACIAIGVTFATLRKQGSWYRMHKGFSHTGAALIACGLGIAAYMVAISGGPHFRVLHGYIGGIAAGAGLLVITLGIARSRVKTGKPVIGLFHKRVGWLTLGLMIIGVITGIGIAFFS